ncbi:MAG: RNA-guided endonuclease IscB [Erythrobacter sp.]|jgi:5-methylcytosine-specific restriction endonuclease McrA|nr:RNA-guided endonuclease IscB [Erythrobacter sp.]
MNRVFVLTNTKQPLMPCAPARARKLLKAGRAAVYRFAPFTIILKDRAAGAVQPLEVKVDPGSKITGLSLVALFERGREVIWAANLLHRGQAIRAALADRRSFRRGRRARHTRYRAPRFLNRARPKGWLPPSLRSRVENVQGLIAKLQVRAPVTSAAIETVRFDTQLMQNPEISGVEYQQGTLAGYELREYLLEKFHRTCAYCGATEVPLEIEHIVPRSRGGSNRPSNLTLACRPCNERKGNQPVEVFLKRKPAVLKRLLAQAKAPLKDAAAVNATRYAIGAAIKALGLPTTFWSGGRTKMNRIAQDYAKDHWIDAACVGETGAAVRIPPSMQALEIKAMGRGRRRVMGNDKYGFPKGAPRTHKRVQGFQTGDLARLICAKGKSAGIHVGRIASIRARGWFVLNKHDRPAREFQLLQRTDGYAYGAAA